MIAVRSALIVFLLVVVRASDAQCLIETVAGGGAVAQGENGPALEAPFHLTSDFKVGPDGLVYIADWGHHRVRRITADGRLETVAGTGVDAPFGDGGPAGEAGLRRPTAISFAPDGSLYILEAGPTLRRIDPQGRISTIAGGHDVFGELEDVSIGAASLFGATDVAVGPDGAIYLSYASRSILRRIDGDGVIRRFAGGGPLFIPRIGSVLASNARLPTLTDVVIDNQGVVYITGGNLIFRISLDGAVERYVGAGFMSEDGTPRDQVGLAGSSIRSLALDAAGRIYWTDGSGLRRIGDQDTLETVWSDGASLAAVSLAREGERTFILDRRRVFELTAEFKRLPLAGTGLFAAYGDGGPAVEAQLGRPVSIDVGTEGELYIADLGFSRVRRVKDGAITTIAGNGETTGAGDGGPAVEASLRRIEAVAAGPPGVVYVAEVDVIRRVNAEGAIEHWAGGAGPCELESLNACGDGGPATDASLNRIIDLAADDQGNLYILTDDRRNNIRIRRVEPDGTIITVDTRLPGGGRAEQISDIAITPEGDLLVVDSAVFQNPRLWRLSPDGSFSAVPVPDGFLGFGGPSVGMDAAGNVFFGRLLRVSPQGTVESMIRPSVPWTPGQGDGGPPQQADFDNLSDFAVAPDGRIYLADLLANRVRSFPSADCPVMDLPRIAFNGVLNAASFDRLLSPGALFSVFGESLGPDDVAGASVVDGALTNEIGGVRVWIGGLPSPMIFASRTQLNAVVPFGVEEGFERIEIEYQGLRSEIRNGVGSALIELSSPAIFLTSPSQAAALNEDGTLNSPANPAAPGSVVVLFGTGAGHTDPPGVDGAIVGAELPRPVLPVTVRLGQMPAELLYAGGAPGLVSGVLQLNFRVPADALPGPARTVVTVGEASNRTQSAEIHIGP